MPETYKWQNGNTVVKRGSDGASIPNDPGNKDWQGYQDWVTAGGVTSAADPLPTPAEILTTEIAAAVELFLTNPQPLSKAQRGLALVTMDELNSLRQWDMAFKAAIAGAGVTSIATLKTAIAGLPNLPDRNPAQIKGAVQTKLNSGDAN